MPLDDSAPVATQEMIDEINAKGTWVASMEWTKDMTIRDAKKLMGTFLKPHALPAKTYGALAQFVTVPDSFDSDKQWPECTSTHPVRNQEQCGSCWAFGAAESLGYRYCVGG
jgi:cathepsin B